MRRPPGQDDSTELLGVRRLPGAMDHATRAAMKVFWELHEGLLQQSPGSATSTRRAFEMLPDLPPKPRVLDLGCGPGRQTFDLAALTDGTIRAVDLLPPFIEDLNRRASGRGLADRVVGEVGSMIEITPEAGGYDLIWCEGAVYNVGLETGLRTWREWLAPGGCLVVSEATWLKPDPPAAAAEFWQAEYPAMQLHEDNLHVAYACGYDVLGSFPQPPEDWHSYYEPIDRRIEALREGARDPDRIAALDAATAESELYRASGGSYSYVFYVLRPGV